MSLTRFYCENIKRICELEGSEAHHLSNVLRFKAGDTVELFDGKGTLATAAITKAGKRNALLEPLEIKFQPPRHKARIVLVVSVAKDQRFDWLIGKAVELGVDHICPAIYQRTAKLSSGNSITQRYLNIAISSSKQCKRLYVPIIDNTSGFNDHIKRLGKLYSQADLITASLSDDAVNLLKSTPLTSDNDKIIFVGPEGGFTDEEEALLKAKGAIGVRLTNTVLRIETAAIAISSVLAISRDSLIYS